ncbi:MAG: DUF6531 domain-containing protein, partial [Pseudomonas sp.]|uniref:DUF6531 domain-containing protein n=1 Tax=Pseudomonas sp. TaxID=306 RepID=UPI003BB74098
MLNFSCLFNRLVRSLKDTTNKSARTSIYLFFGLALICSSVNAKDYYWTVSHVGAPGEFSSASEACAAWLAYQQSRVPASYMYRYNAIKLRPWIEGSSDYRILMCALDSKPFDAKVWSLKVGGQQVARRGDTCPPNTQINPTNGECANDPGKGDPGTCPSSLAGDPINTSNGNSFQTEVDHPKAGVSTLNFTRVYNSLDGLWRHNHSIYLRLAGTKVALIMADGRESFFTVSSATTPATVTASPTELGRLTKAADTWRYTAKNNDTYSFDATGRLTRWTNAAGAEHLLSYASGSVTVTDKLGQTLSFTEDAQHQALTLTAAGLTIQYDYNANQRLSKLTRTRGGQTEQRLFHYEIANKPNLLTGITDERGVRFTTWTFDDKDRATSSEHAGGVEHTQITYNADGSSTVTNEFGKKFIYRFVAIDGVKRVNAVEGEALGSCPMSNSTFTYDTRGLLKTKTDNKGFVT